MSLLIFQATLEKGLSLSLMAFELLANTSINAVQIQVLFVFEFLRMDFWYSRLNYWNVSVIPSVMTQKIFWNK